MQELDATRFLEVFKDAIIGKTGVADRWLDEILTNYLQSIEDYHRDLYKWEEENGNMSSGEEREEDDMDDIDISGLGLNTQGATEYDLSKLSTSELEEMADDALDNGDSELLAKVGNELSKR